MKVRICKAIDSSSNEILYQLNFKMPGEYRYYGYSYDMFKTLVAAQKALKLHESGEREYQYKVSTRKVHVLVANPDLPESIIWSKIKRNDQSK